jgi:negative regulator of sigma E activity
MTRVEREQLIARYLGGEMSATEEQEFFIRVAVDKELRQDLRAQRTVESALRKDRDAESTGHTALRMRIASVLAATPAGPGAEPIESPRLPAARVVPRIAPPVPAMVILKWLATVATVALAAAATIMFVNGGNRTAAPAASPTPATQSAAGRTPDAHTPAGPSPAETSAGATHGRVDAARERGTPEVAPDAVSAKGVTTSRTIDRQRGVDRSRARTDAMRQRGGAVSSASTRDSSERIDENGEAASDVESPDVDRRDDSIDIGIKLRLPARQ